MEPESIIGILLAAGQSERFGVNDKMVALYNERPLVLHAAHAMAALGLQSLIAVTRPYPDAPSMPKLLMPFGFTTIINETPKAGLSRSIVCAIGSIMPSTCQGVLICLADMPNVTNAHLAAVCKTASSPRSIIASSDGNTRSPPCFFGRNHFNSLLELEGDQGARGLLRDATVVEVEAKTLHDVDSPADLSVNFE